MMMSTPKQRQLIGYFRKILKLNEDTYRDILAADYRVDSALQLTYENANDFLARLKVKAAEQGQYIPKTGGYFKKYENIGYRRNMATPKQLRYINVLWKTVSNQSTDAAKEKALNSFLFRITGKERVNFLTQDDVKKVIKAIQTMQKQAVTI